MALYLISLRSSERIAEEDRVVRIEVIGSTKGESSSPVLAIHGFRRKPVRDSLPKV